MDWQGAELHRLDVNLHQFFRLSINNIYTNSYILLVFSKKSIKRVVIK